LAIGYFFPQAPKVARVSGTNSPGQEAPCIPLRAPALRCTWLQISLNNTFDHSPKKQFGALHVRY
jgi:hypothetical protein